MLLEDQNVQADIRRLFLYKPRISRTLIKSYKSSKVKQMEHSDGQNVQLSTCLFYEQYSRSKAKSKSKSKSVLGPVWIGLF
ncbi:hypothetical protein MTR_4g045790 [Medicago truncatula]|uniref:Uncharacterized protein n=2 Tax=Medicago truncatula TaxID=3880 RepID=A0A072UKG1_MEDTR|nr:hypothetical protein MTR_4g045790 [Medicago truncatula]